MAKPRVLIFIVSYNAESFIQKVLTRIPEDVWHNDVYSIEVLIIDDKSSDKTFSKAAQYIEANPNHKIKLLYNPVNQGYGGNQKLGYFYAIKNGFDAVVLLHGDGQYAPEYLDKMIRPITDDKADVVFGSRMVNRFDALKGGMPIYKWFGNQSLTLVQNTLLHSHLSEFHTGYRAYRVASLAGIPFEHNANYFDFDTDIIIQMLDTKQRIIEVSIPTYYGAEISYVNSWKYGVLILRSTLQSRLVRLKLFYDQRFDYDHNINEYYTLKLGYASSHQFALDRVQAGMTVLDIGSGPGYMAKELTDRQAVVISIDRHITPIAQQYSQEVIEANIDDFDLATVDKKAFDVILLLDIIEHVHSPEALLLQIRQNFALIKPKVIITTGNVAFVVIRLAFMFGQFNYGKKGILDRDHRRLFTFGSMRHLLEAAGYEILEIKGIPVPVPVAIGDTRLARALLLINQVFIRVRRSIFAYQMAFVVRPKPMLEHIFESAQRTSEQMLIKEGPPDA